MAGQVAVERQAIVRKKAKHLIAPHQAALRMFPTTSVFNRLSWNDLITALSKLRGRPFPWSGHLNRAPKPHILSWLEDTPPLYRWALGSECLVSPQRWPRFVLPAFKYRLIPTPYDITNVQLMTTYATSARDMANFYYVLLYGMGFSVHDISKGMRIGPSVVIGNLHDAIENLVVLPQFIIWASATDFRYAKPPPMFRGRNRAEVVTILMENPFKLDNTRAEQIISSQSYLTYLIYGSPKRLRLGRSCRMYRTIEAPNGS